jgi:hypothetical protein
MDPAPEANGESILLPSVTEHLSTSHKEQILNRIWGFGLPTISRVAKYKAFFEYYESQVAELEAIDTIDSVIHTHEDFLHFMEVLKGSPDLWRTDLKKALRLSARCITIESQSSVEPPTALEEPGSAKAIDSALATAVRIMYAIHLGTNPGRILVGQSAVIWSEQILGDHPRRNIPSLRLRR